MSESPGSPKEEKLNPWELAKKLPAVSSENSFRDERSCVFQKASISTCSFQKASHGEKAQTHDEKKLSPWELAKNLPASANGNSYNTERACNFQSASASTFLKASHGDNGHHSSSQNGNGYSSDLCDEKSGVSFTKATSLFDSEVKDSAFGSFQKASSSSVFQKSSLNSATEVITAKKIDHTIKRIMETSDTTIDSCEEKNELPAPSIKKIPTFGVNKMTGEAQGKKIAPKFACKVSAKKPVAVNNLGIQTTPGKNDDLTKGSSDSANSVSSENDAPAKPERCSLIVDSKKPSHTLKPLFAAGKVHQSKDMSSTKLAATSKNSLEAKKFVPTSEEQMGTSNQNIKNYFNDMDVSSSLSDKAKPKSHTCHSVKNQENQLVSHDISGNKDNATTITAKDSLLESSNVSKTSKLSVISPGKESSSLSMNQPKTSSVAPSTVPDSDNTVVDADSVNHSENDCKDTVSENPQTSASVEHEDSETAKTEGAFNKSFKKAVKTSVKIKRNKKANNAEDKLSKQIADTNSTSFNYDEFFNKVIKNAMENKLCSPSKLKKDKKIGKRETQDKISSKKEKEAGNATHTKSLVTSKMDKVKRTPNIHQAPKEDSLGCQRRKRSKSESSIPPKENERVRHMSESESSQRSSEDSSGSILATSLEVKEKINKILESTFDNWVQCDQCHKWRKLPGNVDPSTLPRKWSCKMNLNKEESICEVAEDDWNKENVYVYDGFVVGSVVWARVSGSGWHPAMVDIDPDFLVHNWLDNDAKTVKYYHVTFLGDPVSRGWVTMKNIVQFFETDSPRRFSSIGLKDHHAKKQLQDAVHDARVALKLGLEERKKKYSFVSRFRGAIGGLSVKKKKNSSKRMKHKLFASERHLKRIKSDLGLSEDMSCEEEEETSKNYSASKSDLGSSKKNEKVGAIKPSYETDLSEKSGGSTCIMARGVSNGSSLKENENSCNPKEESLNNREAAVMQKCETIEFKKQDNKKCNTEGLSEDQDQEAKKDRFNSDIYLKERKDAVNNGIEMAQGDEINKKATLENSVCNSPREPESKILEHLNSEKEMYKKDKNKHCSSTECQFLDDDDDLLMAETGSNEENLYEDINAIIAKLDVEECDGNVNESLSDKHSQKNVITYSACGMYPDQMAEKPSLCVTGNAVQESQEIPIQYDQL